MHVQFGKREMKIYRKKKDSTCAIFHFKVLLKAEIVCSNMDLGAIDLSPICNSSLSMFVGTYMYVCRFREHSLCYFDSHTNYSNCSPTAC